MAGLTAVTFDLWQTLIVDSPELGRPRAQLRMDAAIEALQGDGFDFPRDHVVDAFRHTYAACDEVRMAGGDYTFDEQIDIFLLAIDEELHGRLSPAARARIAKRYADCYLDHPPQIDEHAETVLRGVRERQLKVALICNTGSTPGVTQRVFLERAGLAQYFDTLVFSDEERLSKPAREIFQRTLERIDAEPEGAVHVGDHGRNDVFGAKQAGLRAIWVRRKGAKEPEGVAPDACIDTLDQVLGVIDRLL